ncbi:MAG TPA: NAD(+) diphosphatase [Sphingomicrobium sp.]|nr:NAD(+) diphosphatase [Sphingomicrobium sp.]
MRPSPFFSGPGLDRADSARADPERIESLASHALARELVWSDGLPAISPDGALQWRDVAEPSLFLGMDGDSPRFCPLQPEIAAGPAVFALIATLGPSDAPLFAAALSLARWHSRHQFCANCGTPSEINRGGWSRRCPTCDSEHYPRVDPVVIMLAEHDGKLLLGRQYHYPPRRYSALAGFVEVGETIEDAVARELGEESGVEVAEVEYIASQPWPFPSSLMVGCIAKAASRDLTIDYAELEDARWFTREEVEGAISEAPDGAFQAPPPHAIARTLLEHWLAT